MEKLILMNGKFLLDTNIVIPLFAGESAVLEKIEMAQEIYIPIIVMGELYYGAYKSVKVQNNLLKIEELGVEANLLDCNRATAKLYGQIKSQLKSKGTPIPENDIWIAAIAQQYDLTLVSRDNHFQNIENLTLERW